MGPSSFRNRGLCRGFQAGVVAYAGTLNILAIYYPSMGSIRVADRDAIVERNEERVGVSVKKRIRSAMWV